MPPASELPAPIGELLCVWLEFATRDMAGAPIKPPKLGCSSAHAERQKSCASDFGVYVVWRDSARLKKKRSQWLKIIRAATYPNLSGTSANPSQPRNLKLNKAGAALGQGKLLIPSRLKKRTR
jgi:hypothetical protein